MLDIALSALLIGLSIALIHECQAHTRTLGRLWQARAIAEDLASKNDALRKQLRPFQRVRGDGGKFVRRDAA